MPNCWHCSGVIPDESRFCNWCGYSQTDRFSAPLFVLDVRTGLFNATFLQAIAGQELLRTLRYGRPLAVLVLELDEPESLSLGEADFPGFLSTLAEVIAASIRDSDTLGYLGGDHFQFGVILPETNLEAAAKWAEKLRKAVVSHAFVVDNKQLRITLSAGVAEASGETSATDEDLFVLASTSLLSSREEGSGRIRTHNRG